MTGDRKKPSPEELLRRVEAEEGRLRQGRLKIFLGYASGVGKSFRMLDEGRRRKMRGEDVVVGAVQPVTPDEVKGLLDGFEVIPLRTGPGGYGVDVPAIRRRHPAVCLIDGLAYRNPPGSANAERWQDVDELLRDGISVISTINLQYVRERQAKVEAIRGRRVEDSVPEAFLRRADDIEVVDAPPESCAGRAGAEEAGNDDVVAGQLAELREIALLLAAEVIDAQLEEYLKRHGIEQSYGTQERVLLCLTPRSNAGLMVARGRRQAERFHGGLYAVYFERDPLPLEDRAALEAHLAMAREAGAHVETLRGKDLVGAVLAFCEAHGITQIFVGHSQRKGLLQRLRANPVERLIAESNGIDIRVFPNAGHGGLGD